MKRVLILTLDFPPSFIGGISAWSSDLADALHHAGYTVTVIAKHVGDTTKYDGGKPYTVLRAKGRSWAKWQSIWMRWAARNQLDEDTFVFAATWRLVPHVLPLIQKRGATLATAFHGSEVSTLTVAPKSLQRVVDASDHLFPVSQFLGRELERLNCIEADDARLQVLPMPINLTVRNQASRTDDLICVARPMNTKGIERAIRIAQAMNRNLHLVGPESGPEGTTAHGILTREDTLNLMAQANAIILTPRTNEDGLGGEGLGLVLLEAAALGVPAIGCDTGGVMEAVGPGLILDDPDHPDIEQIHQWLDEPKHGVRAQNWVREHHGADACISALEQSVR